MADFKFGSQNAKALRFEFELTTFDESGEQVECKPFLTHLTTQKKAVQPLIYQVWAEDQPSFLRILKAVRIAYNAVIKPGIRTIS